MKYKILNFINFKLYLNFRMELKSKHMFWWKARCNRGINIKIYQCFDNADLNVLALKIHFSSWSSKIGYISINL